MVVVKMTADARRHFFSLRRGNHEVVEGASAAGRNSRRA
jgi:hypothetical protein